jgi:steroid 5-alpha reductase family enzyme
MFLGLFLLQGTLMGVLSLPFAMVAKNPIPAFLPVEWVAMGLWLIGFLGETLADKQLQQFKANPNHQGKVCSVGLWRYSRHPNYFFEWVMWVSYFVMGLGVPGGWVTFYVPLLMLFFLTKVTGIAATEAHALKTRGEAYRRYQAETSPFIPWFPKQS